MKERPILFSAPMIRALLAGTKTQTRREIKFPWDVFDGKPIYRPNRDAMSFRGDKPLPYGTPGSRLWVRETFGEDYSYCDHPEMPGCPTERWHNAWRYRADGEVDPGTVEGVFTGWKPSIHMPRAASRITLELTEVRVERLQDISEADAVAEGAVHGLEHDDSIPFNDGYFRPGASAAISAVDAYRELWDGINGPGSWGANPWVWVLAFKRVTA